ncbi:sugar phosphate isomerase/epimerase family protein [Chloroflexota bacterium]
MKLSLTVQTPEVRSPSPVSLLSGTFEERLVKAARLGADGLELLPIDPASLPADQLRTRLEEHGLAAAAIGTVLLGFAGVTLLHADPEAAAQAQTRLREMIDFAGAVGAPLVTIGGFRGRVASTGEEGRDRLDSVLRDAAVHAEARDVRLALEPINHFQTDFITSAEEGLAFLEAVGHPALGLLLDTCHMNIDESSWTEPLCRTMDAGRLLHIHVADNNRLAPGRGLIDFGAIVNTLRDIGYAGYLSAEVLAQPDPDTAALDVLAHMRPLLGL